MPLSDFRVEGSPDDPWADIEPLQTTFQGRVLAFDQSLGATGWIRLSVVAPERILILAAGMVTTVVDDQHTVTENTYRRTMEVEQAIESTFDTAGSLDLVAMELPPTGARQLKQVTSPLMAGYPIYRAAHRRGIPVEIVQGNKAKKRWTGSTSAKKPMVRAALLAKYPGIAQMRPLNEHTTDAVLLALTALDGLR